MGKMFDALQKLEREKIGKDLEKPEESVSPEDVILDNKMVSFFAPSSLVTEQFRRLRTHIIKPNTPAETKTIMITSAMPGEGKSLVAINLAVTIALELHSHALLVDCDLRNPSVSRLFGVHEKKGLSNYLLGESEIPDLLIKTPVDKLTLIPGGPLQDNPVELIGSEKMKNLINELKARYIDRFIILDSSPVLATTEPTVLYQMADGIILVIKAGETGRESVEQTIRLLDKKKILGVVLNNIDFKTKAMTQKHLGSNHKYYDYRYAQQHPKQTFWDKLGLIANDLKTFTGKKTNREKK